MRHSLWLIGAAVLLTVACGRSANVEQERAALLQRDRDWSQTTKDTDKFLSYFASDASAYTPGMPIAKGSDAIRTAWAGMSSAPGFAISWTATKSEVSASGDIGYTAGTYELSMSSLPAPEKGKYVTVWKKQSDGQWKVIEDIFNADSAGSPPAKHVEVAASAITWGDAPPVLPPGAKMAVLAGDPGKSEPFVVRLQAPAGYQIAAHWHPTDENVTVISGTFALGMGDKFDKAALKDLPSGSVAVLPAEMHHFAMAKTATTVQVHGIGPFVITYVNPADDPSQKK
jgi:ketosteroid isomerase-like protein